ncbi:MAG: GH1 family beta-glucosidase [Ktedonobacterales bacterium]
MTATGTRAFEVTETGFPADFVWGTATAAYQIEGGAREGGRGESIWDRYSHTPGKIADGSNGDVACDAYTRWREDLDLMQRLSYNAYRFSVAWPRVFPAGRGALNQEGLDYYESLVDGLLARGIQPFLTLYHWDLPQTLEDAGGWVNRDTSFYFADFAQAVAQRLGDRVGHWITLNEPHIVAYEGYLHGQKAPGKQDASLIAPVSHHLLLAHGLAVQALRSVLAPATRVGITLNVSPIEPATDREADAEAARLLDGLWHRLYLDPLYKGEYPEDARAALAMPDELVRDGDLGVIATATDFLGVNYYSRTRVRAGNGRGPEPEIAGSKAPKKKRTAVGWEVYPDGLYEVLMRLHRDYAPPRLYVTESGAAYTDVLTEAGAVHDPARVEYLGEHFLAARRAIAEGVPLHGYLVWSFMDNFEWQLGYGPRFGLVYTDYATQRRIPKDSAAFVAEVAATNGGSLLGPSGG